MAQPTLLTVIRERDSGTVKQQVTRTKNLICARKPKSGKGKADVEDEGNTELTKEEQSKLDYMHVKDIISKLKQKERVRSLFVKALDKTSPHSKHKQECYGSLISDDPEVIVLCSMLDEAHLQAIMDLRLEKKLPKAETDPPSLPLALKKYYRKIMDTEYRLTLLYYQNHGQVDTKTIMANLVEDRNKIIKFIGGEAVADRLVKQRQAKLQQRKEQIQQYIKHLQGKCPKTVCFLDELNAATRETVLEELKLEIKADIEEVVDKKHQEQVYESLLNQIIANQIVEELECQLLLRPSTNVEEWLDNKRKDLIEKKGTQMAEEVTEIVERTIEVDNSL